MKRSINFLTYAFLNTTLFLPYFLYILIGNQFDTYLNGWFPLIIFYVCNITGAFFFDSFGQKEPLQKTFPKFLLLACIGSLMGMFAFITPLFLDFSSILLGLACSVLLPMYSTLIYHEQTIFNNKLTTQDYFLALISILIFTPCVLLSTKIIRPEFGFFLYSCAFFYCYLSMRKLPDYKLKNTTATSFNIKLFCLFLLLAGLTFAAKALRVLTNSHLLSLLILLISMVFLGGYSFIKNKRNSLSLPSYVYLFSFLQGALTNFMILFATFSFFTLGRTTSTHYSKLYLPYAMGILFSLLCGNLVIKQFRQLKPLTVVGIALILSPLFLIIPSLIPIGAFLIGFFGTINGRLLNRISYDTTKGDPDRSLLYKRQWTKLGSITQQSLLFLILAVLDFLNGFPFTASLATITGHTSIAASTKFATILRLTGIISCGLICLTYAIGLYRYQKHTD